VHDTFVMACGSIDHVRCQDRGGVETGVVSFKSHAVGAHKTFLNRTGTCHGYRYRYRYRYRYGYKFSYPYPYLWLYLRKTHGYTHTCDVH
jgi:hypothetical protein